MKSSFSFPAPKGFSAPEDSKPGQPFEVMATVVMAEDGSLTLNAVDGVPVTEAPEPEDTEADNSAESEASETEIEPPPGDGFLMAIENGVGKKK
jgi:hypothetical protein